MAINKESNLYTIIFATIMVVLVGGLLAFLSISLKPAQQANMQNEKKQNIIQATGFVPKSEVSRDGAKELFDKYVIQRLTINYKGVVVFNSLGADGKNVAIDTKNPLEAFNIEPRKQYRGVEDVDMLYPIFVCKNGDKIAYVVSCSGKGLWDDIWGYIGIADDGNHIIAAKFDHKGETAGLGSVINEAKFQDQFNKDQGRQLEGPDGNFKGISVVKPGSVDLGANSVDGLSGATFTGNGVGDMLNAYLKVYSKYFKIAIKD
ncbi:MAG: Na+-transporting NADH:ubiquinone oxidoreductase subunit C [Parvicella sp.]|jgi:Na+-transporting NADH:ubiquinone oxidoreductase subunit C